MEILRDIKATGFDRIPCQLLGKSGEKWSYHYLVARGRCGAIDRTKCRIENRNYPAGAFPVAVGVYFDPGSWDRSDVFMSSNEVGWVFVTERIVEAFRVSKVGNVEFTSLDEVQIPTADSKPVGSGGGAVHT